MERLGSPLGLVPDAKSGESKLHTPHLSEICDVREFFWNGRFRGR